MTYLLICIEKYAIIAHSLKINKLYCSCLKGNSAQIQRPIFLSEINELSPKNIVFQVMLKSDMFLRSY